MRVLIFIIFLIFSFAECKAQNKVDDFVIVTIEKETTSKLHPSEIDYWIISRYLWKNYSKDAIVPLYMYGFSLADFKECVDGDSLILYNYSRDESFNFDTRYREELDYLVKIVKENRKKVQTIKKKWEEGYKEEIEVFLTPISGIFNFCSMVHADQRSMPEYAKKIGMPVSNFKYDFSFWDSQDFKELKRFDYTELEFVSLHQTRP